MSTNVQLKYKYACRCERTRYHPASPDRRRVYSRRGWDTLAKIWRRALHLYDPVSETGPATQQLLSVSLSLRLSLSVIHCFFVFVIHPRFLLYFHDPNVHRASYKCFLGHFFRTPQLLSHIFILCLRMVCKVCDDAVQALHPAV